MTNTEFTDSPILIDLDDWLVGEYLEPDRYAYLLRAFENLGTCTEVERVAAYHDAEAVYPLDNSL